MMRANRQKIVGIISAVLLCCGICSAQSQDYTEWENRITERWWVNLTDFSRQDVDSAIERWNLIEIDNKTAKSHEWAGGYFKGSDTHGTYMRWSPQTGFVMAHVNKCAATLTGLTYGRVTVSPASVDFVFEYHKSSGTHSHTREHTPGPMTIRFVPIKWSYDQYLVPENQIAAFGNYVAGLGDYNHGALWLLHGVDFFGRSTSEAKSNYDKSPEVPPGYERLIKKPIDAEITVVGTPKLKRVRRDGSWDYENHTLVSLNVGRVDGVKRGMLFRVLSSDEAETVTVAHVGRNSSQGVIVRWLDENKREYPGYPKIRVGWQLSTSMHK